MKKLWVSLLAISFFMFNFCGCDYSTPTQPVKAFQSDAVVELSDMALHLAVISNSGKNVSVEVTSPETLKGLKYQLVNSTMYIEYSGLRCIADDEYLTDYNPFSVLIEVLISMKESELSFMREENDYNVFKGRTSSFEYLLFVDKASGYVCKIQPMNNDFEIILSDFSE